MQIRRLMITVGLVIGPIAPNVNGAYVDEVLSDSPVAYWRLNEKNLDDPIVDLTGNVGNGEFEDSGGIELGLTGAIVGDDDTAAQFAFAVGFGCGGGCGRGIVPTGGVLDLGTVDSDIKITMEAWFQLLPSVDEALPGSAFPRIFHYNNFEDGQYSFGLVGDESGGFEAQRTVWAGRGDGSDAGPIILAGPTDAIEPSDDEEWYHFVAQLDADEVTLFLNGEELDDLTESDPISWQAEQASIGARLQSDETTVVQSFPGLIDELAIYNTLLSPERIEAHYLAGLGQLSEVTIDTLQAAIRSGANDANFDLNNDGAVNLADQQIFIRDTLNTWVGDSNLDGEFSSGDLVFVFQKGEYEDNDVGNPETILNSTWGDGDWNADGEFNSGDFVIAFQEGGFEMGPRAVVAVPEPSSQVLIGTFCFALLLFRFSPQKSFTN